MQTPVTSQFNQKETPNLSSAANIPKYEGNICVQQRQMEAVKPKTMFNVTAT